MIKKFALFFVIAFVLFAINVHVVQAEKATPAAYIQYDLAFPGILPDNPLYKIKVIKEKITNFLISSTSKKIDFYLLSADKGILATAILVDKNKIDLVNQTALRAEHNMTLINMQIPNLSKKPEDKLFNKLITASRKHQEVLSSLIQRLPKEKQETLINVLNFSKSNLETLERFSRKNPNRWHMSDYE